MTHPLVDQLRFTRSEWLRALRGFPDADGQKRLAPMNSVGWIVAHLAWQEQRYFLTRAQDVTPFPVVETLAPYGGPPTTPPLRPTLKRWREVTTATDPWLDALTEATVGGNLGGPGPKRSVGDAIHRVTYHYWFHIGEILALRQLMGHPRRPEYVGEIERLATYRPEGG